MSIAKILVSVNGTRHDAVALTTAIEAAKPFGGHIEAVYAHADPRTAVPYCEAPLAPEIIQEIVDEAAEVANAASAKAKQTIATVAAANGVKVVAEPAKSNGVTIAYKETVGYVPSCTSDEALLCDLVVFPPLAHSDNPQAHATFIRILTGLERPVMLSPEAAPKHIGKKVAIAWDGRQAAAHALVSALPFLEKAQSIEILSVQHKPSNDMSIDDARDYLALHGLGCTERLIEPGNRAIADVLLDAAVSSDCDLMVAGGYGHSRLAESIFGGVTDTIVSHPRLPVLMVH
jgi:nucleotide-binding universal stress UspA family protein